MKLQMWLCHIFPSTFDLNAYNDFRDKDKNKKRKRSPTPRPCKVHVGRLTRNVNKDHIQEIFSLYGTIKYIDMPNDRIHPNTSRGHAYVEYENPDDAEKAVKYMDGGTLAVQLCHISYSWCLGSSERCTLESKDFFLKLR